MKRLFIFLLAISMAANAWLLLRVSPRSPSVVAITASAALKSPPPPALAALDTADPAGLVETLRAAGVDEVTLRAMVEGVLRSRYRAKLAAVRIERTRTAWWRNGTTAQAGDAALAKTMVDEPMERLFGHSSLALRNAESRYAFLPEDKRQRLARVDLDYADLLGSSMRTATIALTRTDIDQQRMVAEEKRKDVLAALTPEERSEYDLRFGTNTFMINPRAAALNVTEEQYRALSSLVDDFDRKSKAIPRGGNFSASYDELQRATAQQFVSALGYEQTIDYLWSGYNSDYIPLRRAADNGQLPNDTPGRVMELAMATGQRARDVHADTTLTLEQKQAAFVALQQASGAQLDALLPPEVRRNLPPDSFRWLTDLSSGRYSVMQPSLLSSGGYYVGSLTLGAPLRKDAPSMPVRPTGK